MAKRVLFGWELGKGNGHLRPFLPLFRALADEGWEVGIAQHNTAVASRELAAAGWPVFQSPVCMNEFSGISPDPANHVEIYLGAGFAHADTLLGLVNGWRALFRTFHPDLVIGNYAPSLMLAAHASGIPAIRIGSGFSTPPHEGRAPLIRPWSPGIDARLDRADAQALRTANAVLREFGLPVVPSLATVLDGGTTLLTTLPELDPFHPRASAHEYIGPLPTSRASGEEGEPPEIFASLLMEQPHAEAALRALSASGRRTWAYVPDATPDWCARISTAALRVSDRPFDVSTALAHCRVIVCYGGHNLVLTALLAGRPVLLLPGTAEQRLVAGRVTALGAGIAVGREEKPARVAAALKQLLQEAAFIEAARRFQESQPADVGSRALARVVAACQAAASPSPVSLKVVRS